MRYPLQLLMTSLLMSAVFAPNQAEARLTARLSPDELNSTRAVMKMLRGVNLQKSAMKAEQAAEDILESKDQLNLQQSLLTPSLTTVSQRPAGNRQ